MAVLPACQARSGVICAKQLSASSLQAVWFRQKSKVEDAGTNTESGLVGR